MRRIARREFAKRSAIAGLSLAASRFSAQAAPFARIRGANEDVRLAVVGVGSTVKIGGKGKQDIRDFRKIPGVRVVALCDVDHANLDPEAQQFKDRNEKVDAYTDVRKLLEDKNIDAVTVTTPNHWHALVAIWACQAGKDVFVQKPASHNIFEGRRMVEAARKYGRIVMVTSGSRGRAGIIEALEYVRRGNLGKMLYVHGVNYKPRMSIGKVSGPQPIPKSLDYDLWSGPAPVRPVMREYLHYDWHWDWLYGNGDLGNMGIHYLDGCRIAVGRDTLPPRVVSIGGRFGYDDDGKTPNTQITFLDYEPAPILFEVRGLPKDKSFLAGNWEKNARQTMDSYKDIQIGLVVHCEGGYVANNKAFDKEGKLIKPFEPANEDLAANFIKCVRSRKAGDLQGDVLQGHLSAALIHMTNASYRLGKAKSPGEIKERIQGHPALVAAHERFVEHLSANGIALDKTPAVLGAWLAMDPEKERFTGDLSDEANRLVTREYREPFVVPDKA